MDEGHVYSFMFPYIQVQLTTMTVLDVGGEWQVKIHWRSRLLVHTIFIRARVSLSDEACFQLGLKPST
jgi:hypothetical protein